VSHVWEGWLSLKVLGHHGSSHALSVRRRGIALIVLVVIRATVEVCGSFVLVWPAVICVPGDELPHVTGGVLVQLLVLAKDEHGDIDRAQYGQLMCLLEEAALALQEGARVRHISSVSCSKSEFGSKREPVGCEWRTYTERFLSSLMALISIFLRPILKGLRH
jgi:hypothetical protein